MGTVCCAPEIPVFHRPINPYLTPEFFPESPIASSINQSLHRKMVEDYQTPVIMSPMNPYHLAQLPLTQSIIAQPVHVSFNPSVVIVPTSQPIIVAELSPQSQLLERLRNSPEAIQNGPPLQLATPCDIPPVTQAVIERRKTLSRFQYDGQTKGVQLGPYMYNNSRMIYFGQWQSGSPHGKGLIYFPDGTVFEGGFVQGKSFGRGRLISKNGDYYEGTVSGQIAEGSGISQNIFIRYQGQFQNNLPHGQGTQTQLNGMSRFVGTFYEGNKISGVLSWGQNGEYVYQGRFSNNMFNGRGILTTPLEVYYGQFANGLKNGQGDLYNRDGSLLYRGNWTNNVAG